MRLPHCRVGLIGAVGVAYNWSFVAEGLVGVSHILRDFPLECKGKITSAL